MDPNADFLSLLAYARVLLARASFPTFFSLISECVCFFGSELRKLCHYCLKSGRSMGNSQSTFHTAVDSMTNGSEVLIYLTSLSLFFFCLKVSKCQNEFMKSTFLPKYEANIVRISTLYCATLNRAEILTIFLSYFGRNDDFINSFWYLLTFMIKFFHSFDIFWSFPKKW